MEANIVARRIERMAGEDGVKEVSSCSTGNLYYRVADALGIRSEIATLHLFATSTASVSNGVLLMSKLKCSAWTCILSIRASYLWLQDRASRHCDILSGCD